MRPVVVAAVVDGTVPSTGPPHDDTIHCACPPVMLIHTSLALLNGTAGWANGQPVSVHWVP